MATDKLGGVLQDLRRLTAKEGAGLPDWELLERFAASRDDSAFESLVARHGPLVFGVCQRVLHDATAAEDAFQATFLVLARKAASIRKRELLSNWLYGVAHRTAAKARVSAVKRRAHESGAATNRQPSDPLAEITARELLHVLDEELQRLPARCRAPLISCYLEGRTRDEAAHQLGWSLGTLKRRLEQGRELLQVRLARRGLASAVALVPALFSSSLASAAVPSSLAAATAKAGVLLLEGKTTMTELVSAKVAALAEGALQAMFITRLKIAAVAFLATALVSSGVGFLTFQALTARQVEDRRVESPRAAAPVDKPNIAPKGDRLQQALSAAWTVEDDAQRVALLVRIAHVQGKAGNAAAAQKTLQEAIEITKAIEEATPKGMALSEITWIMMSLGDAKGAIQVANLAENQDRKDSLLHRIASEQADAGDLKGAFETAKLIADSGRFSTLMVISIAQAKAGDIHAALQTAERLRPEPLARAGALEEVALAQANTKDRTAAAKSLQEALALYDATLAGEDNKNGARAGIAVRQAKIGDIEEALRATATLKFDRTSGYHDKAYALRHIALEQLRAGDAKAAFQTIDGIQDLDHRADALVAVAEAQTDAGDALAANETLQEATRVASTIQDKTQRDAQLVGIGVAEVVRLTKSGRLNEALKTAQTLAVSVAKASVLFDIAKAQTKAGDKTGARTTLGTVLEALNGFRDEIENPMGVITLAPGSLLIKGHWAQSVLAMLVETGGEEEALRWANAQRSPFVKALSLLGIAEGSSRNKADTKRGN